MLDIYKKIDTFRKSKGLAKMEFYRLIGMSDVGYSAMTKNHSIKLSTLEKIVEVLDISIFHLLDEKVVKTETDTEYEFQMSAPLDPENTDDIIELEIPDSEKIVMMREKISMLTLQLKFATKLADLRKDKIEKMKAC